MRVSVCICECLRVRVRVRVRACVRACVRASIRVSLMYVCGWVGVPSGGGLVDHQSRSDFRNSQHFSVTSARGPELTSQESPQESDRLAETRPHCHTIEMTHHDIR
jgi:hypothetical protein